jgi:AcrR family transcriptional regulator
MASIMASMVDGAGGSMGSGELGGDELATHLLNIGGALLAEYGLHRWSMDDVAERAGVGRTSVYRKFSSRDDLVHAVLARELRQTFESITEAAADFDTLEDKIVEGALVALGTIEGSLVTSLLTSDPTTFLPFLTTEAGPLLALARELLVAQASELGAQVDHQAAAELAELAARLGVSFILTRQTVFPTDDPEAARSALHRVLGPMLAPLAAPV